jgi:uncharacterized protein YggE
MATLEEIGMAEAQRFYTREEVVLVRITDLEHKVKVLDFAVDTLIRQVKDMKYRLSQDKSIYE